MTRERSCVAVVDDDPGVLRSIARLLSVRGFEAKTFSSAESLLEEVQELRPGCIIADLSMPGLDGLAFQQALVASGLDFPIVFITANGDIRSSVQAMRNGAIDFLAKPFDEHEFFDAVERALRQNRSEGDLAKRKAVFHERAATLTRRELEVFAQVVEGFLNKQIAANLGIAEKTVKVHRSRIMKKMAARSLAELARAAERFGIPARR